MPTSSVEYAAVARADSGYEDRSCRLYRNGVGPYPVHAATCSECDLRLYCIARERERHRYRVRDRDGRVLTASWLL